MAVLKLHTNDAYLVGDVVTLRDRMQLMTVEGVRPGPFGLVIDCCWFEGEDSLRFSSFPAASVDVFPRPSPERAITSGSEVRLRSRGPVMSVGRLRKRDGVRLAECIWTGPTGIDRRRLFPTSGLVFTLMERFQTEGGEEY